MQTDTNLSAATQDTTGARTDSRTASPRRERFALLFCLLAFALLYGGIAQHLNGFRGFWSSDCGARFAMIRNWQERGSIVYLHYDNADVDPEGQLHPLGLLTLDRPGPLTIERLTEGYIVHLPKGFCTQYPPLFPYLSGLCYRLFGFSGLTVLPLLAGLGTLVVTYALAKQLGLRSRLLIVVATGATTPLLIYSVVFWDHTLHFLLTGLAGYLLLRALEPNPPTPFPTAFAALTGKGESNSDAPPSLAKRSERVGKGVGGLGYGIGSGMILGVGMFFHEMFGALFVALLLGSVLILREKAARQAVAGMVLGFAPMLVLWGLVNWKIYGIIGGPHLIITSQIKHAIRFSAMFSVSQVMWRMLLQVVGYEPSGSGAVIAVAGLLVLMYVACLGIGGRTRQVAPLVALLLVPVTLGWLHKAIWAHGLFETTPLLIAACAFPTFSPPLPSRERGPGGEGASALAFYRWMGMACLIFGLIIIVNPQVPGLDWGSRYLLTILPLLAVLAARALEGNYAQTTGVWRSLNVVTLCALAGVGLYANVMGGAAVAERIHHTGNLAAHLHIITEPAIVFNKWYYGAHIVQPPRGRVFLMRDLPADAELFFKDLDRLGISEFSYSGTEDGLDPFTQIALQHQPPYRPAGWLPPPQAGIRFVRQP